MAERIAVAEAAIQQKNKDQSLFQPAWYFERNANFTPSWDKSEFRIMKIVRRENLQSPSIIRATCVFDAKFSKFSKNRIELSACVETNKKNFENFDFCSEVSAFLVDFSAQESAQFNTEAERDNISRLMKITDIIRA